MAVAWTIMWRIETRRALDTAMHDAITALLDDAAEHDGFRSLSDHLRLELGERGGPGFGAVLAFDDAGVLGGYAQLAAANASTTVELVIAPRQREHTMELAPLLLHAALDAVAADGGGTVHWWVHRPDERAGRIAAAVGLVPGRQLMQMRRPLPLAQPPTLQVRPFVVGRDEQAWLRVNNAAFFDHPEQGGWTIETLRQREAEPWFDADGFLLAWRGDPEDGGELLGSHWTKVHPPGDVLPDERVGEVYVLGIDPDAQGMGLGRTLTDLGLARTNLLHVAQSLFHDHVPAKRLGLTTVWIDRRAGRDGPGGSGPGGPARARRTGRRTTGRR
jgi:mycothiol synthase